MFLRWLLLFYILTSLCIDAAPPNRDTADDLQNADMQRQWEQEQRQREEVQVRYPFAIILLNFRGQWKLVELRHERRGF